MAPASFSIIIPVFNLEAYLERTLRSIRTQSDPDFEALLIDDGSTDGSPELCRNIAAEDPRFRYIRRPHCGKAAAARNYGIRKAVGNYLLFCDGDDWIEPDTLARFREGIARYGAPDMLGARVRLRAEAHDGAVTGEKANLTEMDGVLSGREALIRLYRTGRMLVSYSSLNLYRREFMVEHKLFQNEALGLLEDHEWAPRVYLAAGKVAAIDYAYYNYWKRADSLSTGLNAKSLASAASSVGKLEKFYARHAGDELWEPDLRRFWAAHALKLLCWYFFNPLYEADFGVGTRKRLLKNLFGAAARRRRWRALARFASRPLRLGMLLALAGKGRVLFPARWYFQRFYYPLTSGRRS